MKLTKRGEWVVTILGLIAFVGIVGFAGWIEGL